MALARSSATLRPPGALVIGGDYRALGVVRSLGRHNVPVWVLTNEHRVASMSRYAQSRLHWPSQQSEQLGYLITLCNRHRLDGWVIFPSDDEAAVSLARHHETLSTRFSLACPKWDVLRWCYDKRLTFRLATVTGVTQPHIFKPDKRESVVKLDCTFPVILKPAFKESRNPFTNAKAWRANDRGELLSAYDEACRLVDPDIIMIQELIPGGGKEQVSFACLSVNGQPIAWMTARRTRQHPLEFGRASSFVECIEVPDIVEPSKRLLRAIGFTGIVEIEFKRDPRDGAYKLLDINPRVWGWHTLGYAVGLDFPYLLWKLLRGETIPEVRAQSSARWIRMLTDVSAAWGELVRGRLSVTEYLRSYLPPLQFAIFAADDPLPVLGDAPYLAWLAWRRWHQASKQTTLQEREGGADHGRHAVGS